MCPGRKLVVKKDISVLPHWKDTAWTGLEDSVKSWACRQRCKRSVGPGLAPTECLVAIRVGPDFTCAVMQTGKVTSEVRGWPRTQRWSMKVEQLLSDPCAMYPKYFQSLGSAPGGGWHKRATLPTDQVTSFPLPWHLLWCLPSSPSTSREEQEERNSPGVPESTPECLRKC